MVSTAMRSLDTFRLRLRSLFLRPRVEAELAAEINFHLEQLIQENRSAGMGAREARQAALRAFGGPLQIEERCREMRGTQQIEELVRDLTFAWRTFRKSPVFTLVAVFSLALGIGANTAIFSLVDALLLRQLPVEDPARLVALGEPSRTGGLSEGSLRNDLFSAPMYQQIRDQNRSYSGLYASGRAGRVTIGASGKGQAEAVSSRIVSGNFFSVLGIKAVRGRTLSAEDDRAPGASPVVVISYACWQKRFAQDPNIVGRVLNLNGAQLTVVGVTPPGFTGDIVGRPTEIWIPLMMQKQVNPGRPSLDRWEVSWLLLMGRLKPGVTLAQARAEADVLFAGIIDARAGASFPKELRPSPDQMRVKTTPGAAGFSPFREQFKQPLLTLLAIVGLVLVVACANVANLLLERALGRQKEIAVRLSVGAGQMRLIRQLLTESLLLSCLGGALGVLFSLWAGPALLRLAGVIAPTDLNLRPDLPTLAFTAFVSLATGILFGLAPARRATSLELAPVLKENARTVSGGGGGKRWPLGKLLVVAQFALSLLLLTGAGLFIRSLQNLGKIDLGYDRARLVLLGADPVAAGYQGAKLVETFPQQIVERLKAIPGVRAVSYSENGIFSGTDSSDSVQLEGFKAPDPNGVNLDYDKVGPDYFETVGISIVAGRGIGGRDRSGTPRVAVVNQALAKLYFPDRSPIGQHIVSSPIVDGVKTVSDYEIVGVSRDVHDHELRGAVAPRFYLALMQSSVPAAAFNVELRTDTPRAILEPIRRALREYDADLPISDVRMLSSMIDDSIARDSLIAELSAIFGLLALALASIGLYGVISFTIARRTNEIGIRMALGAKRSTVLWMVLRETMLLALAGVALGVPAALLAARFLSSRLFGLSASDPSTLLTAIVILIAVATIAGAFPGSRATRVEPTQALRYG